MQASLDDDKAQDIVVIDLTGKTALADHMVIATGQSQRQVGAMADHLRDKIKDAGFGSVQLEGQATCDWVLVDAGDVLVHLFRPEVRDFYQLERMWDQPAQGKPIPRPDSAGDADLTGIAGA
ncbi:MAG: ribosome silencing factor [Rhodospirillales bacterium]